MPTTSEHGRPAAVPFARHTELQRWGSFFETEEDEIHAMMYEDRKAEAMDILAEERRAARDYDDLKDDAAYRSEHPVPVSDEAKAIAMDAMQRALREAGIA